MPGLGSGLFRLCAVLEAIAVAVHFEDMDMVREPVEAPGSSWTM